MINDCTLIKEIAKGGQKTVYLATHPTAGKVVIKRGVIKSFISLERIKREIDLLSELKSEYYPLQHHFNIDIKTKEFEIVEDYIEGSVLRSCMLPYKNNAKDIFKLLRSLTKALAIIWEKNIVHRDLKPENIIIRPNGTPCIIDLGIARFLELESLTKTISPMGPCTPVYAAPEQLMNHKNGIDHRTDFFVLGIIALELYLGGHPFDPVYLNNEFSIVENILQNKYSIETSDVKQNEQITALASKTLTTQPFERFRNNKMFQDFLERVI